MARSHTRRSSLCQPLFQNLDSRDYQTCPGSFVDTLPACRGFKGFNKLLSTEPLCILVSVDARQSFALAPGASAMVNICDRQRETYGKEKQ